MTSDDRVANEPKCQLHQLNTNQKTIDSCSPKVLVTLAKLHINCSAYDSIGQASNHLERLLLFLFAWQTPMLGKEHL